MAYLYLQKGISFSKMKRETYNAILHEVRQCHHDWDKIPHLCERFPNTTTQTIGSIISQDYKRKLKAMHSKLTAKEKVDYYCQRLAENFSSGEEWKPGFLLSLAKTVGMPPSLLARVILERRHSQHSERSDKSEMWAMLKDSSLIDDPRLAIEVQLCVLSDPHYGPISEAIKKSVGEEHEQKLQTQLTDMAIPFLDEQRLHDLGYDKTPDVKLEIPFAIDGHVVNWIESKALFGDDKSHEENSRNQYWPYWNRFGSGLVIYWFDFIEDLNRDTDKILLMDRLPAEIVRMNPKAIAPSRFFAVGK